MKLVQTAVPNTKTLLQAYSARTSDHLARARYSLLQFPDDTYTVLLETLTVDPDLCDARVERGCTMLTSIPKPFESGISWVGVCDVWDRQLYMSGSILDFSAQFSFRDFIATCPLEGRPDTLLWDWTPFANSLLPEGNIYTLVHSRRSTDIVEHNGAWVGWHSLQLPPVLETMEF